MKFTNRANLPPHLYNILKAAYEKAQENYISSRQTGDHVISVTELIAPAQKRRIENQHASELEVDVLDTVPSLRGVSLHHILELAGADAPEHIPEERLQTHYDGWTITGKSDAYTTSDNRLIDFKDSSVWTYIFGKPEWEAQLNVLRWIREKNGGKVSSLEVDLFCGDWRRSEARRSEDYPNRVVVIPVKMWTMEETTAYVDARLKAHRDALDGNPPPCTPEERWAKPTKYAVMKQGRKTALAVYDSPVEATPGTYVEVRPGESVRCCKEYCKARPWCPQAAADPTLTPVESVVAPV